MDTLFALKGKDFVAIVADTYSNYSILRIHDSVDKIMEIGDDKALALAGPEGDCKQFGEFIRRNIHLHQIRAGLSLSTEAAANFTRYGRKRPYAVAQDGAGRCAAPKPFLC